MRRALATLLAASALGLAGCATQTAASVEPTKTAETTPSPRPTADADLERRGPARVVHTVDTRDNVVFLTVDDGLVADPALLRQLEDDDIPVTVFLTTGTVRDWSYWSDLTAVGSIQNHTVDHPQLPALGTGAAREICEANSDIVTHTGQTPWMMRPPYGAFDDSTLAAAGQCGLDYVVHWSVTLPDDVLEYQSAEAALKPGDIILTHFRQGLAADIRAAVADIRAQGFEVARLEDYLRPRDPSAPADPAAVDEMVMETDTESRAYPLGG